MASAFQRFILWDYPRASWQYDVVVVLIVGFIFLTPREFFKDQPRGSSIAMLRSEGTDEVFYLEPKLLESLDEPARLTKAGELLKNRDGKKLDVHHVEAVYDEKKELTGFIAYARTRK